MPEADRLQHARQLLLARQLNRPQRRVTHRQQVVPVHPLGVHVEGARLLVQLRHRRALLDTGAHPELVVHDQEDDRQLPQLGDVQRLVPGADVGGGVAHLADHHLVRALVRDGQPGPRRQRQLPPDDGVAAHEPSIHVEQVHRAAPAPGDAGLLAEQLRHDPVRVHAAPEDVPVLAVVREHVVALFERRHHADDGRLFAQVQVAVAADLGASVHLAGLLLEPADQDHLAVEVDQLLFRLRPPAQARGRSDRLRYARRPLPVRIGAPLSGRRRPTASIRDGTTA
jgi:hypothetical protein